VNTRYKLTLILITLAILLCATSLTQKNNDEKTTPLIILDTEENIVKIAVTYQKLTEKVQIWPHPIKEEYIKALINLTETEINQYCKENQYKTRFKLLPTPIIYKGDGRRGDLPPGLEETMQLKEDGINLIVGHDFSLANRYSFEYADENDLLLFSPSGIGHEQSKPDDSLYKLTPNIYENPKVYDQVFAEMIKNFDYKAFITINTGLKIYQNLLDETAEATSYPYHETEVIIDLNADDFGPYIEKAAEYLSDSIALYGEENICILVEPLFFNNTVKLLDLANKYPGLSRVTWYDIGGLSEENIIEQKLECKLARYGFVQLIMSPANSHRSEEFYQKYSTYVGPLPTPNRLYGEAARYDAMWLMVLSVIRANSTKTEKVKELLPVICNEYNGILGNCSLNKYGDRVKTDYSVYEWIMMDEEASFEKIGYYNSSTRRYVFTY
jgi:ABC-type branched-subunit amino acid transport system substrate-binding protein